MIRANTCSSHETDLCKQGVLSLINAFILNLNCRYLISWYMFRLITAFCQFLFPLKGNKNVVKSPICPHVLTFKQLRNVSKFSMKITHVEGMENYLYRVRYHFMWGCVLKTSHNWRKLLSYFGNKYVIFVEHCMICIISNSPIKREFIGGFTSQYLKLSKIIIAWNVIVLENFAVLPIQERVHFL